jgi:ubiquitin
MTEAEVLNEIRSHLNFLKEKIIQIEITVNEIDSDVHRKVNPIYIKKLDKIEQEDKRVHFKNIEEFDKHFGI